MEAALRAISPALFQLLLGPLVVLLAVACLPPKRDNSPLADDASADATDGALQADAQSDGTADGTADGGDDVGGVDSGTPDTADLPQGCTVDSHCAAKPAAACKQWRCNKTDGKCNVEANAKPNSPCDDDNPCTVGDACNSFGDCNSSKVNVCDDNNPCTQDKCLKQKGGCVFTNKVDTGCIDGNKCTGQGNTDKCIGGKCIGAPIECKQTDGCKVSTCNPKTGNCDGKIKTGKVLDDAVCDDSNPCTTKDKCFKSGLCAGEGWKKTGQCSDGNACTDDNCNPAVGCLASIAKVGETAECTDSDPCVTKACTGGKCVTTNKVCDLTTNVCQVMKCDSAVGGCKANDIKDGTACADAGKCAVGKCNGGGCMKESTLQCNDNNPCTNDSCIKASLPAGGCKNVPNNNNCVDGSACTSADKCKDAVCTGTVKDCSDNNDCTADSCDPVTGACSAKPVSDGTKCAAGTCTSGKCA